MSKERIKRLRAILPELNLDACLITNLKNVRYLSGYTGTEGTLLITKRSAYFYTDSRYTLQAQSQIDGAKVTVFTNKFEEIEKTLSRLTIGKMGVEGDTMTLNYRNQIAKIAKGIKLVALGSEIDALRLRKDPEEIAALREVIALSEKALGKVRKKLRPGITEVEFARSLEIEMIRLGAQGIAFDTIVASGSRGALPHGVASDRIINERELVVVDYGAVLNGYHSDQTVTFPMGKVPPIMKKVYEVVYDAQKAAIDGLRPGMSGAELDAIGRDVIEKAGYGRFFGHGLGHGVGLDIHEGPRASSLYKGVIDTGMVVTIEPGIYLPGEFGVRLEDMVLVTEDGAELLTTLNKKWHWD